MSIDLSELPNTEFDWPQTLKIHHGNEELATQLCTMLLEQLDEFEQSFTTAFESQNWEMLKKQAHKLRGGLCYLSTPRLSFILKHLEERSGEQTLNQALITQLYKLSIGSMGRLKDVLSQ